MRKASADECIGKTITGMVIKWNSPDIESGITCQVGVVFNDNTWLELYTADDEIQFSSNLTEGALPEYPAIPEYTWVDSLKGHPNPIKAHLENVLSKKLDRKYRRAGANQIKTGSIKACIGRMIRDVGVKTATNQVLNTISCHVYLAFTDDTWVELHTIDEDIHFTNTLNVGGLKHAEQYLSPALEIVYEAYLDEQGMLVEKSIRV